MPIIDFLCLANSRKLGGKCIAGIDITNYRWLRPVSRRPEGHIIPSDYRTSDGKEMSPLQLYSLEIGQPHSKPHHPEDYYYNSSKVIELIRFHYYNIPNIIEDFENSRSEIISGHLDRIPVSSVDSHSRLDHSLEIVVPINPVVNITTSFSGTRQIRISFSYHSYNYNLVVTDIEFCKNFLHLPNGRHDFSSLGLKESRTRFVISLGEPFNGDYYKLIATVLRSVD